MIWLGLPILAVILGTRCAWRIGNWILRPLRFHSAWEQAAYNIGAGLAVMSGLLLLLGLFGGLYRQALWAGVAVVALSDIRRWRVTTKNLVRAAPLLLLLLPFLARALRPPGTGDALLYHLPLAKSYALTHAIRPLWWIRFPVLPLFAEILSTLQFALGGELAAQLHETAILVVLACALYGWGARHYSPLVGALAAAAFVGNPIVARMGTSAYTDLTLSLFFTLALGAAVNWQADGERGWLWLAGAFAGCAASCKYTGMLAVAFVCFLVVWGPRRPRDLVQVLAAALLVAAPFYGYIVYCTKNPLFPFQSNWFGYHYWNAEDLQQQLLQMHRTGAGRSLKALILLPWNLIFAGDRFVFEGAPSPFCLLALPALAAAAFQDRRLRSLVFLTAAFVPIWFWKAQFPRYLLPIAPVLSLAAAAAVGWVAERAPRVAQRLAAPLPTAAACLCLLFPSLWDLGPDLIYPIPESAAERFDYLATTVPGFALVARLNSSLGGHYSLYGYDAELALFTEGRYMGDWFGPARYADFQPSFAPDACSATTQPMLQRLRDLGADHFLYPRRLLPPDYGKCGWFRLHFERRFEDDAFVLFRILY